MRDLFPRSHECASFYFCIDVSLEVAGREFFGRWAAFEWIDCMEAVQVFGPVTWAATLCIR